MTMLRSTLETAWLNVKRATSLAWAYLPAKDQSQGQLGLRKVRCNETKRICTSDKKICMLKTAGRSNIAIAKIVGASYRAVGNVLHRERQKGNVISHHSRRLITHLI
jgi:hypothetical protein